MAKNTAVNPKVVKAARDMSARLTKRNIPHALIGALAFGAHGYERATGDVDFLVTADVADEIAGDSLGGEVWGKTVKVGGIDIDLVFPSSQQEFLEADLRRAKIIDRIPVLAIEPLIYMKMVAGRAKDNADIIELLKRGKVDKKRVVAYLNRHDSDKVEDFNSIVMMSELEPD